MSKNKEIRIGQQIIHEDDLKFPVEYQGETFTLKYPSPYDRVLIETSISKHLGGLSRSSYPMEHLQLVEAMAYVDYLVVRDESPSWFKGAWTCYDEMCIQTLYTGYCSFRVEFQSKIEHGELEGPSPPRES